MALATAELSACNDVTVPYLTVRTMKHSTPTASPNLPMAAAKEARLPCRGVSADSVRTNAMVLPHSLFSPTAVTSTLPLPSVTCTCDKSSFLCFFRNIFKLYLDNDVTNFSYTYMCICYI